MVQNYDFLQTVLFYMAALSAAGLVLWVLSATALFLYGKREQRKIRARYERRKSEPVARIQSKVPPNPDLVKRIAADRERNLKGTRYSREDYPPVIPQTQYDQLSASSARAADNDHWGGSPLTSKPCPPAADSGGSWGSDSSSCSSSSDSGGTGGGD